MPAGPVEARSKPRSIRVRDELTQRIDRGMLPAGSRLPSEPALAVELGVSRATLPGRLIAKRPEIADQMLTRSIYEVLERELGLVIHHGVASFRPVRADVTVARRLGVPRGELLLAIWQVDYSEDGAPVLSSYEYHLADAFEFTVLRRGPGRRLS